MKKTLIYFSLFAVAVVSAFIGCTVESEDGGSEQVVISAASKCSWYYGAECEASCQNFSFETKCQGEVDLTCDPYCKEFEIDVDCEVGCQASCEAECTVDPGTFDCDAYCQGECSAQCDSDCATSANAVACQGKCEGWCQGNCGVSCDGEPLEVDCKGSCEASCKGECTAEANFDCHLCDVDADVSCATTYTGDCKVGCEQEGVLECNGEFIDRKDLDAAVAWVKENVTVDVDFEGDAECHGNACSAEGSCEAKCAVGSTGKRSFVISLLLLLRKSLF